MLTTIHDDMKSAQDAAYNPKLKKDGIIQTLPIWVYNKYYVHFYISYNANTHRFWAMLETPDIWICNCLQFPYPKSSQSQTSGLL